jgi:murein DD-endopeptidase MepM/ murein hydrolase activator NlpD/beta-lactamase regulating signal transducer with metallopeptidase domain
MDGGSLPLEHYHLAAQWLQALAGLSLKGSVILLGAGLVLAFLRRTSASVRHLVLGIALTALLALPAAQTAVPMLDLPLLPTDLFAFGPEPGEASEAQGAAFAGAGLSSGSEIAGQGGSGASEPTAAGGGAQAALRLISPPPHWTFWVAALWAAGALAVAARLALSYGASLRILLRAGSADEGLMRLAQRLAAEIGLRRPVRVAVCEAVSVPVAIGFRRPMVILPGGIESWPSGAIRSALLHEMAHVKRGDILTRLVIQAACVLYWFNPLVWLAARRLMVESEKAADDAVLNSQTKPSDYACHLLEIASALREGARPAFAHVGMARRNNFKERVMSILDSRADRRAPGNRLRAVAVVAAALAVVPLAAIQPWFETRSETAVGEVNLHQDESGAWVKLHVIAPKGEVRQGDPILIELLSSQPLASAEGEFMGQRFRFAMESGRLLALAAAGRETTAGEHELKVEIPLDENQGKTLKRKVAITVGDFRETAFDFGEKYGRVFSDEKIHADQYTVTYLAGESGEKRWSLPFVKPMDGSVSFAFGALVKDTGSGKTFHVEPGTTVVKDTGSGKMVHVTPDTAVIKETGSGKTFVHNGVDLRAPEGTPVKASNAGKVVFAGDNGPYGICAILDHGGGVFTLYAHMSELEVTKGQMVEKGEMIGLVGSTGTSTAPHLHWSLIINGVYCDPMGIVELR